MYSLLKVFIRLNNEISYNDSIKNLLCCETLFSFLLNRTRALGKQQQDTLLSNHLEIEGLGIYFAKEPYRPRVINSLVYLEVRKLCGPQPCSPSCEQRYYGLYELKLRTPIRKLHQNSTKALLGGLISPDLLSFCGCEQIT